MAHPLATALPAEVAAAYAACDLRILADGNTLVGLCRRAETAFGLGPITLCLDTDPANRHSFKAFKSGVPQLGILPNTIALGLSVLELPPEESHGVVAHEIGHLLEDADGMPSAAYLTAETALSPASERDEFAADHVGALLTTKRTMISLLTMMRATRLHAVADWNGAPTYDRRIEMLENTPCP